MELRDLLIKNISNMFPVGTFVLDFQNLVEGIRPGIFAQIVPVSPGVTIDNIVNVVVDRALFDGWIGSIVEKLPRNPATTAELDFILAQLRDQPQPTPADPFSRVQRYLRALERELEFVYVTGVGQDLRLADVFVPPHLTNRGQQKAVDWPNLDWQRPIALVGTAGAGKSTLLRHLAYTTAKQCLDAGADLGKLRDAALRIPFLVDLHNVSDYTESQINDLDFGSLLTNNSDLSVQDIKRILAEGDALLLFDKFDEVAADKARVKLAQQVRRLQGGGKRANGIVLASRARTWMADISPGFVQIVVEPLEPDQIETIVKKSLSGQPDSAARILNTLRSSDRVRQIASNPQLLGMLMLVLQEDPGRDLSHRVLVYESCIQKLAADAAARNPAWSPDDVLRMLTGLALAMRSANEPKLDLAGATKALAPFDGAGTPRQLLEKLELHTGLIVADQRFRVIFVHQTFQEYLLAREYALTDGGLTQLLRNVEDPTWSEALRLAAGVLADQQADQLPVFFEQILSKPRVGPGEQLSPDALVAWAPRVAAASICFVDLKAWDLADQALEPVRRAHALILPLLEGDRIDVQHKVDIATGLGAFDDPRLLRDRWIRFDSGQTFIGSDDEEAWPQEKPAHRVTVPAMWLQRWPVTVGEYRRFIDNDGYTNERWWDPEGLAWLATQEKPVRPDHWEQQEVNNHPVTGVSHWETIAYCRWFASLGGLPDGWTVRLPNEAEWERAARGPHQLADPRARFPWGSNWDARRANSLQTGSAHTPVGVFASEHDELWDMAGNVMERCLDRFLPYDAPDTAKAQAADYVVRGGAYTSGPLDLRVSVRNAVEPGLRRPDIGFRCAAGPLNEREGRR